MNNVNNAPKPLLVANVGGQEFSIQCKNSNVTKEKVVVGILQKVKDATVVRVKNSAVSTTRTIVSSIVDGGKFISGINNIENAYNKVTEDKKMKLVEIKDKDLAKPSTYKLEAQSASYWKRGTKASGELAIAGVKMSAIGSLAYAELNKYAPGYMPLESLTLGEATGMFHDGVSALGSYGFEAGEALMNNVAIPLYNSEVAGYVLPMLKNIGSALINNVATTTGIVAATTLLYSAKNDYNKRNENILDTTGKVVNGAAKTAYFRSAILKGVAGLAVGLGTLHYQFS